MEHKFLVIEINGDGLKDLNIVGRYGKEKDANYAKDWFKKENVHSSYVVSKILED